MSPVPEPNDVFRALHSRATTAKIEKPTDPDGLVLEAWAQGFMVGALIIMSCITLANMRRGVLLHKLILLEVRHYGTEVEVRTNGFLAGYGLLARLLHPLQPTDLCVVAVRRRDTAERFVVSTQCDFMDEAETISVEERQSAVHWDHHTQLPVLGG